jgi:hypothetical protein
LFGLSLVLFSSGIELFGEKIVATWMALAVIALSRFTAGLYSSRAPPSHAAHLAFFI